MAQVYTFTDSNGEVRLMAEINPAPGGGLPAGSDKQIQYNDGGTAFGASPDFVWDGSGGNALLKLATAENGTAEIIGNGLGAQVQVSGADGDASHVGGEVVVRGGGSSGGGGGDATLAAGVDLADADGGSVHIESGASLDGGGGGDINVRANPSHTVDGRGGDINVVAGAGATGGNVIVQGGQPAGNVQVYSSDGNQGAQIDNTGVIVLGKVGFYGGVPVDQPVVPLTLPTTQNVIAALVALGLIVQHD